MDSGLDYNKRNEVVGVEMLSLSNRPSTLDLSALHFETVSTRSIC